MPRIVLALVAVILAATFSAAGRAAEPNWTISIASLGATGDLANGSSYTPALSYDGRYVAFDSNATNLVPNDTNGVSDVFLRDMTTGEVERVTLNNQGVEADKGGDSPTISADGRFVAFQSTSTNLAGVAIPASAGLQAYLFDRQNHTIALVSEADNGDPGNGDSLYPTVSANGRYVVFSSTATNLVPGDTNGTEDIFVRDMQAGVTERVSVDRAGNEGNREADSWASISGDGRYVAFQSLASNLTPMDTNNLGDIFVRDRQAGTTVAVLTPQGGVPASGTHNPSISADGKFVGFLSQSPDIVSSAPNQLNMFLFDGQTKQIELVSRDSAGAPLAQPSALAPRLSSDGRYVAFLVGGVFVRDRTEGVTIQADTRIDGSPSSGGILRAYTPLAISGDGHTVAFASSDANLVPGDTNGSRDIFAFHFADLAAVSSSSPSPTVTPAKVPPTGGPPSSPEPPIAGSIAALGLLFCGGAFIALRWNRHLPH